MYIYNIYTDAHMLMLKPSFGFTAAFIKSRTVSKVSKNCTVGSPREDHLQVVFAGRSNVGKSSLETWPHSAWHSLLLQIA